MGLAVNASIVDSFASGLGLYAINLIKELADVYDDPLVYTSMPQVFPFKGIRLRSIRAALGPAHGKVGHFQRLLWSQLILPKRLSRDGAKILFSPIPEGPIACPVPTVLVVHDLIPLKFPHDYPLQWQYFRWFVRPLLRRAKKIIAVSEQTKADLIKDFGISSCQIHVIPGGCAHDVFHSGISPDSIKRKYQLESYCLYVGNFHPHKNLPRLIQAFHSLAKNGECQLVIVGKKDPRYSPALQSMVERLGLKSKVVFLGYVPQDDLPGLYAGAEVFILPSLYEGFGLPLLEAMACGVPVIAAKTGAMKEIVETSGMLVDPTEPQEMADAIHKVLTDKSWRERLSYLGLQKSQKYSWRSTAQMVSKVIQVCEA
jgi:glycosyltransferase involved in cell wall biosynthesis